MSILIDKRIEKFVDGFLMGEDEKCDFYLFERYRREF